MKFNDIRTEEKVRLDPKCWTGKKIGNPKTKMKGGVRVNNCVPAESVAEDANPNFIWIQGDFDGDTAVSGPEQGSWKNQITKQVELIRGRLSNVERLDGPPPQGGKTIKQARIPLTLDAGGGQQFSTTGVDLELTVAPNGYITRGDYGRVRGTAVVKIMRPGAANEGVDEDYNPEYDDEAGMADNNLETLKRAVEGIDDLIQSGDNLPEWCQEKISNAKGMLVAVWDYMYSEEASDEVDPEVDAMFEAVDRLAHAMARRSGVDVELVWESFEALPDHVLWETAQYQLQQLNEDWQKVNKQDKTDGMSRKAVKAYRRENPGSKLKTAVTTKPSKLKKGGKAAKRRKSFCARMRGMKKSRASAKTKRNPNSPINKALRRWNC